MKKIRRILLLNFIITFANFNFSSKRFTLGRKAHSEPLKQHEHVYKKAAVATDNEICSKIGMKILLLNGTAIDSLISVLLCLGVVHPHSSGLGGGGFLIFKQSHKSAIAVNFREEAPDCSFIDMMKENKKLVSEGGLSVAVPGELKLILQLWKQFGNLPLIDIVRPAFNLAKFGFKVSKSLRIALEKNEYTILGDPFLKNIFSRNNKIVMDGQIVKNRNLAKFLRMLVLNHMKPTFESTVNYQISKEIHKHGGCLSFHDLNSYRIHYENPLEIDFGRLKIITTNAPSSGPVLVLILNILKNLNVNKQLFEHNRQLFYHFLIEAFKFGYAYRSHLSDPKFEIESQLTVSRITDYSFARILADKISPLRTFNQSYYLSKSPLELKTGTTHISILDQHGTAVSVTSTINGLFGAKFASKYGFIYNNEMDDFSYPAITNQFNLEPTEVNYVSPKKRPQSSVAPMIITDRFGEPLLIIGASGGSFITSAIVQVIVYHLFFGMSLKSSIEEPRIHCQLYPDTIFLESQFNKKYGNILKTFGHKIEYGDDYHAVVQSISKFPMNVSDLNKKFSLQKDENSAIYAESDYRKGGLPFGI